jgi:hypothetical protein
VFNCLFKLFETFVVVVLPSVLVHVFLHLWVVGAQLFDQLLAVILLVQISNIFQYQSQQLTKRRIVTLICHFEGFLDNVVAIDIENDLISLLCVFLAGHKACFW